jgi:hypothetical protein
VHQAREAFACLILHALFFIIVLWGILPYYSMRAHILPTLRTFISCSCGLLTEALTIIAIYVGSVSWGWSVLFEADGHVHLARNCRAITIFLGVLWVLGWCGFLIFLSVAINFGIPSWIRQMLIDMRKLIAACVTTTVNRRKTLPNGKNVMTESV